MFESMKKDPYILDIYEKVENPEQDERFWTYHGLNHVNNVIDMVEKTLIQLEYDDEYIENAKIAALLHDLGMIEGKEGHDVRSYLMTKEYFGKNKIVLKYQDEILEAIRLHRDTFDSNSVMATVLIFADKIDIKKSRLAPNGYDIVGLRQYQYIDDINIIKEDSSLTVQFVINEKCDRQELEDWYFTAKVFNAINAFANHFGFNLKILWNNDEWILNSNKII